VEHVNDPQIADSDVRDILEENAAALLGIK
jgi:hypothetical protein